MLWIFTNPASQKFTYLFPLFDTSFAPLLISDVTGIHSVRQAVSSTLSSRSSNEQRTMNNAQEALVKAWANAYSEEVLDWAQPHAVNDMEV